MPAQGVSGSSLLEGFLALSRPSRLLVLGLMGGALCALLWYLTILPVRADIRRARHRLEELDRRLQQLRLAARRCKKLEAEIERLQAAEQQALAQLPNRRETVKLLEQISREVQGCGLRLLLFRPGGETVKELYAEIPLEVTAEGSYAQLLEFLRALEGIPRLLRVTRLEILRPRVVGEEVVMEERLRIVVYRLR